MHGNVLEKRVSSTINFSCILRLSVDLRANWHLYIPTGKISTIHILAKWWIIQFWGGRKLFLGDDISLYCGSVYGQIIQCHDALRLDKLPHMQYYLMAMWIKLPFEPKFNRMWHFWLIIWPMKSTGQLFLLNLLYWHLLKLLF